ncbi:hypothetical protein V8F20_011598 [Naviculisporaceae sp. PSN 640]
MTRRKQVRLFNQLDRSEMTPCGQYRNHWVFGICHVASQLGDIIFVTNPQGAYMNISGKCRILELPTAQEKAEAVIPHLLDIFLKWQELRPSVPAFAPWSWSTLEPDMAQALESSLKKLRVMPELCKVGVCTEEERGELEKDRDEFYKTMASVLNYDEEELPSPGDSTKCHGCGLSYKCFFRPLIKCSGCGEAFYHSVECQTKHRKKHKPWCDSATTTSAMVDARAYYQLQAQEDPEARDLMNSLRLQSQPKRAKLALPMHRLVLTGQDTPENLRLLFGPASTSDQIKEFHERVRLEFLMEPPPGSPCHVLHAQYGDASLVQDLPPLATEVEKQMMDEVREMQIAIRQKVGPGNTPSSTDMQAILTSLGPDWKAKLQTYWIALNTMDQGVPHG